MLEEHRLMGEYADMVMNGSMCECCGMFLDGDEPGYPRKCGACEADEEELGGSRCGKTAAVIDTMYGLGTFDNASS